MKKLILIISLFISVNCFGQQYPVQKNLPSKDSVLVKIIGSGTQVFPKTHSELFAEQMAKQDTIYVPILMLVCDTLSKYISSSDDAPLGNWVTKDKEYYRNYVW